MSLLSCEMCEPNYDHFVSFSVSSFLSRFRAWATWETGPYG